ncbi:nuclear transport factor 2 family protein [Sphingomonas naphthae]|uniref:Nuclear transport factor 2 family protein n=1 Tax=Sphingomonas naphthae TaxID=1813468 RepID=A0ABY7TJT4_9SPHN|nr:nuclear transport factor 2 family protein [Sphingomonas naphthae]WCT73488.1 nuclear transport factor 2 family protein [Sphingomonas naphthae]
MPRFAKEDAASVIELNQLLALWCTELDMNGGADIASLCTEDCTYLVGGRVHQGHDAIRGFYAARNARVASLQKDGVRTQRHTISNFLYSFAAHDAATVRYTLVNYSREGPPPALDLVGPTIVADVTMEIRREADGEWRISLFDSIPIFIGNDPFLNASVVPK